MQRNILLVEPGFKTKYPPLGLMKISTYHKMLGDKVTFFKGNKLPYDLHCEFWDRIYVSTVFTYHWKVTVDTINYYKSIVHDTRRLVVGGILASLMPKELWEATGIMPITGLLNKPGMLDKNEIIIDSLIPDYKLFDGIEHSYSLVDNSYLGYSTRGCVNKCKFCGVPILEPEYNDYVNIKTYVNGIKEEHGEKQNLVLMDNNVLASNKFKEIINDIVDLGFGKDVKLNNKQRQVDFNQGIDARKINKDNIKELSRISIHPLRIAFDSLKLKDVYEKSIRLAAKHEIRHLSNYILYNYKDSPEELWERLKINVELNHELDLKIYSFPMKYIPLFGEESKDRRYIDASNWNWQYIRGVQRILNVMMGTVMPNREFFYRAFGHDVNDFIRILHMPEKLLMSRGRDAQSNENETDWSSKFKKLTENERRELLEILCNYRNTKQLSVARTKTKNSKLKSILEYYTADDDIEEDETLALPFDQDLENKLYEN